MQTQTIRSQAAHAAESAFLRRVFLGNAAVSTVCGLAFILAAGPTARFLGPAVPVWAVLAVGLSLLPFAYGVVRVATQAMISVRNGRVITAMDFAWVAGSYLLLFLGWSLFSVAGRWFIALQAEVILLFGVLQIIGLRRLPK